MLILQACRVFLELKKLEATSKAEKEFKHLGRST